MLRCEMVPIDTDRYYTPPEVAGSLVEAIGLSDVGSFIDSACGRGDLLEAAQQRFRRAKVTGIDRDGHVIAKLRKLKPLWLLHKGDALNEATWVRTGFSRHDVALLNPPFSMGHSKGFIFELLGIELRCSVAMAHLISACFRARPSEVVAIVPESLLYSETDANGRRLLNRMFSWTTVVGLKNSTFRGARPNAVIIRLQRSTSKKLRVEAKASECSERIVRGGLPVHEAIVSSRGLPFLHSTDLVSLQRAHGRVGELKTVRPISRGIVSGHVVLLPRVGLPATLNPVSLHLHRDVQLSDCVIALKALTRRDATLISQALSKSWAQFRSLYRGTGARYITVARLSAWMESRWP